MRQFATRDRDHFNSAESAMRELQRGCVNVRLNLAAHADQGCLIDFRESDFLDGFGRQNRPRRACIDQSIRRRELERVWRSYEGMSYFDFQAWPVEL
jgi:hypothetical protein